MGKILPSSTGFPRFQPSRLGCASLNQFRVVFFVVSEDKPVLAVTGAKSNLSENGLSCWSRHLEVSPCPGPVSLCVFSTILVPHIIQDRVWLEFFVDLAKVRWSICCFLAKNDRFWGKEFWTTTICSTVFIPTCIQYSLYLFLCINMSVRIYIHPEPNDTVCSFLSCWRALLFWDTRTSD